MHNRNKTRTREAWPSSTMPMYVGTWNRRKPTPATTYRCFTFSRGRTQHPIPHGRRPWPPWVRLSSLYPDRHEPTGTHQHGGGGPAGGGLALLPLPALRQDLHRPGRSRRGEDLTDDGHHRPAVPGGAPVQRGIRPGAHDLHLPDGGGRLGGHHQAPAGGRGGRLQPGVRGERGQGGADLSDPLFPVDVWLIEAVDSAVAPVIAAGAEFALRTAAAPQRSPDDLLPLLPGRILDQK